MKHHTTDHAYRQGRHDATTAIENVTARGENVHAYISRLLDRLDSRGTLDPYTSGARSALLAAQDHTRRSH